MRSLPLSSQHFFDRKPHFSRRGLNAEVLFTAIAHPFYVLYSSFQMFHRLDYFSVNAQHAVVLFWMLERSHVAVRIYFCNNDNLFQIVGLRTISSSFSRLNIGIEESSASDVRDKFVKIKGQTPRLSGHLSLNDRLLSRALAWASARAIMFPFAREANNASFESTINSVVFIVILQPRDVANQSETVEMTVVD